MSWLAAEVEAIAGPIDLVGHDWGGGHVLRLVNVHPEIVRSWTTDITGAFDPDYVWHDFARTWQTPGAGEAAIEQMVATPVEQRAQQLEALGMSKDVTGRVAAAVDAAMGRCILALYRSAAQPKLAEWARTWPRRGRGRVWSLSPRKTASPRESCWRGERRNGPTRS